MKKLEINSARQNWPIQNKKWHFAGLQFRTRANHRWVLVAMFAVLVSAGFSDGLAQEEAKQRLVAVEIDFADRAETKKFAEVPLGEDQTILDVFKWLKMQHDDFKFVFKGEGETAFLTEIDGIKNEGARGSNWTYRVNDKLGDRSFGVFQLKPGDKIKWKFTPRYRPGEASSDETTSGDKSTSKGT